MTKASAAPEPRTKALIKQYLQLLDHVLKTGTPKSDRTGTGTLSVFGYQMRFDLKQGFPLVTTKNLHLRSIIHELLWFLSGDTNIKYLNDNRAWPSSNGEAIDQISNVIANIKTDPAMGWLSCCDSPSQAFYALSHSSGGLALSFQTRSSSPFSFTSICKSSTRRA
jgi:hypothetical protein